MPSVAKLTGLGTLSRDLVRIWPPGGFAQLMESKTIEFLRVFIEAFISQNGRVWHQSVRALGDLQTVFECVVLNGNPVK
jgi:hypothetical protein